LSTSSFPAAEAPFSLVRVEHTELKLLRHIAGHAHGIVIAARFDAPHWPKHDDGQDELPEMPPGGMELKAETLAQRVTHVLDPEPWRLPYLKSLDDRSLGRTARTLCAGAVPLPVTPDDLDTDEKVVPLVRATVRMQDGARWLVAPYFKFADSEDRWLNVNIRCLQVMKVIVGDRPFCAWIYVPLSFVTDVALIARRYAEVLPSGATVFLTVCDLQPDLPVDDVSAYLRTILAFKDAGIEVVTDRASELSVLAVAVGARGAILGVRAYRTASESPMWAHEYHPRITLRHLVPGRLDRIPLADAPRRTKRGSIPQCRHANCRVLEPGADPLMTRLHNAHTLTLAVAHATGVDRAALIAEWRAFSLKHLATWAQALEEVMERRAEA
jgi:hypothetical protein